MPKAEDVEGKGKAMGDDGGATGVGSEGEGPAYVPEETKVGAVAQTRSSYKGSLQDPGVWSCGSLMESGVLGSLRRTSSIGDRVCLSVSESMIV